MLIVVLKRAMIIRARFFRFSAVSCLLAVVDLDVSAYQSHRDWQSCSSGWLWESWGKDVDWVFFRQVIVALFRVSSAGLLCRYVINVWHQFHRNWLTSNILITRIVLHRFHRNRLGNKKYSLDQHRIHRNWLQRNISIERGVLQQFHRSQLVYSTCEVCDGWCSHHKNCKVYLEGCSDARSNGNLKKSKYHICAWPFHYREHLNQSAKTKSML